MASLRSDRRFTNGRRCPICGGADGDPRGKEKRCYGYLSSDGEYAHCTREELAGAIERTEGSETYAHRLRGSCKCGVTHAPLERTREIEATYDYRDENGQLLFQVVRFFGKDFRQRRPDGAGGWRWKLEDTRRVLYMLPELLAADPSKPVYIVEGEKDVHALTSRGLVATTNPGGAGKWHFVADEAKRALAGRHVAIVPDADEVGRKHASKIRAALFAAVASLCIVELPAKDVSDWLAAGHSVDELEQIRATTPLADSERSADDLFADRDTERPAAKEPPAPKRVGRTWASCVEEIYARKDEPWIDLSIGPTVIATCRNGSFVPLVAPSGAGKSTLALQMLIDHAMRLGPGIYVTYELDGDEAVGRGVGQLCAASWAGVLRGDVPRDLVPDVPRFVVLERDEATLENLGKAIAQARVDFPGQPVFVVVDYLQATPAPPGKERGFVANVSAELRRAAKKHKVVLIGVSQMSTENSRKARSGDLLGIDSAGAGAETAQIERDAYVILTLGDRKQIDPDTVGWKLSVAKNRMGVPDVVFDLHFRGRIGAWDVVGDATTANEVREQKREEQAEKKRKEKDPAKDDKIMLARLEKEHARGHRDLCTMRQLRSGNGISKERAELALERLVKSERARLVTIEIAQSVGKNKGIVTREIYDLVAPPAPPRANDRWSEADA